MKYTTLVSALCTMGLLVIGSLNLLAKDPQTELKFSEDMLLSASIRGDLAGLELVKKRIIPLLTHSATEARAHYLMGLANWMMAYNGFAAEVDTAGLTQGGYDHCLKALAANPKLMDAYVVALQCIFRLLGTDQTKMEWGIPEIQRLFAEASKIDANYPGLRAQAALSKIYGMQDSAGGYRELTEIAKRYETNDAKASHHERWWHALTLSWLGWQALSQPEPQIEASKHAFQRALTLRPDFHWVREALLQSTESLMMCSSQSVAGLDWKTVAKDPAGDVQNPAIADARALDVAMDPKDDMLWFRFQLEQAPDERAFGVNIAFDSDKDPANGTKWWGGETDFRFDYLVTAWVVRDAKGNYTGTMGISDSQAAMNGLWTEHKRNNLAIHIDEKGKTITLGIPEKDLPFQGQVRLLAAVGSNTNWNDNIPNQSPLAWNIP